MDLLTRVRRLTTGTGFRTLLPGLLVLSVVVGVERNQPASEAAVTRPNIVFVLTDDQGYETLPHSPPIMPFLQGRISDPADHWIRFTNAFLNTPICCPTRATIFTGQYSHHTGVETNGQGALLDPASTIATWLHSTGYYTGLIGKYINKYPFGQRYFIPPGWDRWAANFGQYFNYNVYADGKVEWYGSAASDYSTDVIARKAVNFINTAPSTRPFFLYVSPKASHDPWIPAPRHVDAFAGLAPTRYPNFNEADVSDKPAWVRSKPLLSATAQAEQDRRRRRAFETMLAVDDAMRSIMAALETKGVLDNTVIIYMSDNGFAFGEHRWKTKKCEYEECTRTPFFVRYPGTTKRSDSRLVSSVDIAPTLAALAGTVPTTPVDGLSLLPLLTNEPTTWRTGVLLHAIIDGYAMPGYWAVHTVDYLYVELSTGERELYDLTGRLGPADPYELTNRANSPTYAGVRSELAQLLGNLRTQGG